MGIGNSIFLRLAVLAFSIYMIISMGGLFKDLTEANNELNYWKTVEEQTSLRIDELTRLLESGDEAAIIEKAARERLGYVYADEQVYIDISGD
ncbi:MAG: septum formation initiator family protein [Clostridia bacterium]|nr:septum formation initiator family protein [Clostridia bacterium]